MEYIIPGSWRACCQHFTHTDMQILYIMWITCELCGQWIIREINT